MEALSITGVICRVANKLVKAARGARQCKRRCQDLARRVEGIDEIVREFEAAPNDLAMRRRVLERLRDALEEALEVVQSCRSFIKLLLPGGSTSSRIDNAERKINNCLLELGVANDVLLGLGNQKNTDAGRLAVHDGVVPRTSTVMNNSGIVMNIKAKHSSVRLKQKSSNTYNISAGRSVNTYFGDSSSGPTRRTAATRITSGLHARRAERCASPPQWRESHKVERAPTVVSINNNSSRVSASAGGSSGHVSVGDDSDYNGRKQEVTTMPMRGKRWDDRNGRPPGGECIQNQARAAPGPQMLSTTRAASDMYWTPPSQGPEDCQYPYDSAGDHGGVPYYYYHHPSAEEDPNSCSIM